MATSGVTTFRSNMLGIITGAYEICRVIDPSEPLSDQQIRSAQAALNKQLKRFITYGLQLFALKRGTITLTQGTMSYTCGPSGTGLSERPLMITDAWYRDSPQDDNPLEIISREEYWNLGDKTSEGIPNEIYYDPQDNLGVVYVFNTADANTAGKTIELVYQRPFEDMVLTTDDFDFPVEWEYAIEWELAANLAQRNGVASNKVSQLRAEAKTALEEVLGWDAENTSVYLQPQYNR